MFPKKSGHRYTTLIVATVLVWSSITLLARTSIKPGFNFFTPQQDVEIGREASQQAEKQLALLDDPATNNYVNQLGKKLAAKSTHPDYPWAFKVVNDSAINAFALPGGFIYVNRGALQAADNEAQIAGVISHEIGHVVARHGTNQMSKALIPQLGLAALGGLTASRGGWGPTLARYGVPLGLNLYFLKNSRQAESQADILGTQIMTDAGYDPHQLANFFEKLEQGGHSNVSGAAAWFSDHPSPENRIQNIDREIGTLSVASHPIEDTKDFDQIKSRLKSFPPPPKPKPRAGGSGTASGGAEPGSAQTSSTIPAPTGKYEKFSAEGNSYAIDYPAGWQVLTGESSGVTMVPPGGIQQIDQRSDIVYGIQVSIFEPEGHSGHHDSLETMTDQFVGSLLQGNSYLRENHSAQQQMRINNRRVLLTRLEGKSPHRNDGEVVWISTQLYGGHQLMAVLCIAPQSRFKEFEPAFKHAIESVRFED